MRFVLIVAVVALCGCSRERSQPVVTALDPLAPSTANPPAPAPEPVPRQSMPAVIWVVVIDRAGGGECLTGATVEITRGQGAGRSVVQTTPCSYWDPDYSATFTDVNAGEEVTLRASAPGYVSTELTVIPHSGPQTAVTFELSRL